MIHREDVEEGTTRLVKNEQERAEDMKEDLKAVEDIGREQIEVAREESRTWSAEEDPLCTEAVGWPPNMGYKFLPPYEYPYDWRMEVGTEPRGVNDRDIEEARGAIERMEKEAAAHPDDPLADEAEYAVSLTEGRIARAEEEIAQGEELQREIRKQEQENEVLYEGWEEEYDNELYDDIAC